MALDSSPVTSLGLGSDLVGQVQDESEEERKKRLAAARVSRLTGGADGIGPGTGTVTSMLGGVGGGYGT